MNGVASDVVPPCQVSISLAHGIDAWAPRLSMVLAAAWLALGTVARMFHGPVRFCLMHSTAYTPRKVSLVRISILMRCDTTNNKINFSLEASRVKTNEFDHVPDTR